MTLSLLTFTTLVERMAAAVQGAATQLTDLATGSALRALLEASASVALWMQWLILLVLRASRAGSATGADLDSWMADFGVTRLPATAAGGTVTFSRLAPTLAAFVPVGAQVRTADGTQLFSVQTDTTNSAYSAPLGGYTLAPGVAALTVPVAAAQPGSAANIQAGAITLLATALAGIDSVTNAAPFTNGLDAESDPALRARFINFINSRSRATADAIAYAVASLGQNLRSVLIPGSSPGSFTVIVDDGTGTPSPTTLATAATAIDTVRAVGTSYAVQPPTLVPITLALSIATAPVASHSAVTAEVAAALGAYIAALPIGAGLPLARVAQIAFDADPSITNVTPITLNGAAADISVAANGLIQATAITVL